MSDSQGEFTQADQETYVCRKCNKKTATCYVWESSCGGYEDYKYTCTDKSCNAYWWVDGIDS